MDFSDLEPGIVVLVRASVDVIEGETLTATIADPRPPFTAQIVQLGPDDIEGVSDRPIVEPERLMKGDHVRDQLGRPFEIVTEPMKDNEGQTWVGLWSKEFGMDTENVRNLERIKDRPWTK